MDEVSDNEQEKVFEIIPAHGIRFTDMNMSFVKGSS